MALARESGAEKYPPPPVESTTERRGRMVALFIMPFLIVTMMYATYMGTMHSPHPDDLPVAVVGSGAEAQTFAADLEASADGALEVRLVDDADEIEELVHDGDVAGAITLPDTEAGSWAGAETGGEARVLSASAAGASQATLVKEFLAPYAAAQGWGVENVDLAPLPEGDGSGTAVLFAAMGMMLAGYVPLSALLLGTPNLTRLRRFLPLSLGWAVLTSSIIWLILGPLVGAVDGHFLAFVAIGTLAVMAVHVTQLLFTKLLGPFAVLVGMLLFVIFGVPSSGLAMSIHVMPGFFQWLHEVLPLPAAGQALRSVMYFDGAGLGRHMLVLAAWLVTALGLAALKERRSGPMIVGGPAYTEPDAPLPALAGGPVASYRRRIAAVVLFPLSIVVTVVGLMGLSMHEPEVHDMPVAVVGPVAQADRFVDQLEPALGGRVDFETVSSEAVARERILQQDDVAAYVLPEGAGGEVKLLTAAGAGSSQKSVVVQMLEPVATQDGGSLAVHEIAPLTGDDSNGSNSMYVGMAWVLSGFLFFAVMRGGAPDLTRTRQLLPLVVGWSVGISVWLWLLFDVMIGAVNGHALELIGYGSVTVFATAWATAVLTRVLGLGGLIPAMVVMLLAGVPASGGGLSLYMVPKIFSSLADVLPLPAAVDIARSVTYLDGTGIGRNLLVLVIWGAVGLAINVLAVDPWLNRAGAKPHAPLGPKHGRAPGDANPMAVPSDLAPGDGLVGVHGASEPVEADGGSVSGRAR